MRKSPPDCFFCLSEEGRPPSVLECRSVSARYSSEALPALGRHRSVLARKSPANAAPMAPRPNDHIPIPNSSPSRPDPDDDTAGQKGERKGGEK